MRILSRIEKLFELTERDHGGCDDTTCALGVALAQGYHLIAIESWASSGASDMEFDRLYEKLPITYRLGGRQWHLEVKEFNKIPTAKCGCGSYIYEPEDCNYHCSNCGKQANRPEMAS